MGKVSTPIEAKDAGVGILGVSAMVRNDGSVFEFLFEDESVQRYFEAFHLLYQ